MRVAHLIDRLDWGGAQALLVTFAREAALRSLDTTVISLRPDDDKGPYPRQLRESGTTVKMLSIYNLYDPHAVPDVYTLLRHERFDVLQTHLTHANVLGTIAGRMAGIPVVATLHTTRIPRRGRYYWFRAQAEKLALRYGARRVVAVAQTVADFNKARVGNKPIIVVPNAVSLPPSLSDTEREAIRRELAGDPERKIIISVGRLVSEKGMSDMLIAFALARQKHPEAVLVIAGDGPLRQELEGQARQLGLAESVRFKGNREDIARLLTASDIYVSTSHREGMSLALLEAMSAGIPALATAVGETPKLLGNDRGITTSAHDITAFGSELAGLLDQPERMRSLGCAARAYIESQYTVAKWMDRLLEVYAAVGARPESGGAR